MKKELMVVGKVYNLMFHVSENTADEISVVCIGESVDGNPVYVTVGKGYHRPIVEDCINIAEDVWNSLNLEERTAAIFEGNDNMRIQRVFLDIADHAQEGLYVLDSEKLLSLRDYAASYRLPFCIKPLKIK